MSARDRHRRNRLAHAEPDPNPSDESDDQNSSSESGSHESSAIDSDDDGSGEEESFENEYSSTESWGDDEPLMEFHEIFKNFKKFLEDDSPMFAELGEVFISKKSAVRAGMAAFDYICKKVFNSTKISKLALKASNGKPLEEFGQTVCSKSMSDVLKYVYRCLDCSLIESAIMCPECYEPKKHVGHRIFRETGDTNGGICDCGDPSFLNPLGNCDKHSGRM